MTIWITSDTHFGHEEICKYVKRDGSKLRPWGNLKDMHEALITSWNEIVSNKDIVIHLGDVIHDEHWLSIISQLYGKKELILGNRDKLSYEQYIEAGFVAVHGIKILRKYNILLTHFPVHPNSLCYKYKANVHGHLHFDHVMLNENTRDLRYESACLELNNFKPVCLDEFIERFKQNGIII